MIKKRKLRLIQRSTMDSFSADVNVYMRRHQARSFARNFVSHELSFIFTRFNGKNDNVVLECPVICRVITYIGKCTRMSAMHKKTCILNM